MRSDNISMLHGTMDILDAQEVAEALENVKKTETYLDKIRGSLIGGAVGDALGYVIEFWQEDQIFNKYGSAGITEYELTNGKALISDDTQMTLFTANGINNNSGEYYETQRT